WVRSSAPDTDLEVTLTELRPDGQEVYVQNGWLRASHRALDRAHSTALEPVHPDTQASAEPLPAGQFASARVALFPFAHIFRAGSRLRISVEAPGGNRPFWAFADLPAHGTVVNEIAHSLGRPSKVVLPVIPDPPAGIPTAAPPCGSLRGEPCRAVLGNGAPSAVSATAHRHDVLVQWKAAIARPGTTLTGYRVVERAGGATHDVGATTTETTFTALRNGPHSFEVYAMYTGAAVVAATPSNTVLLPQRHRGRHRQRPDDEYSSHEVQGSASWRPGARF
ncbi:MAG TPA: CocE/NonD family hydrolase C-terminal non-catalytic domain-containing protein, partial [Acidimicrobiia bacterium]|nr:CocE/NonD family hydrolase C-terminal non-catalytic domain-containing protein [Acidimicrobiia bacterium]